jgi:YebC/PmpR family DNA-binding regulatory protein
MKRDTIDNAIARGAGTNDADNMEELTYEGYAPGGVAILVEVMTDNRNRTVGDVRHAFTKRGGNLGTDGSVAYLFSRSGLITFAPGVDEDVLLEVGLESGADDVIVAEDGSVDVLTPWESLTEVKDALMAAGLEPLDAEVTMLPSTEVELDIDTASSVMGLIDMLEDLDDVQNVYSNANISEAVLSAL